MPFASTNELNIYYERGGEGSPLLFISGSGGDLRNKPNQLDSPLAGAFELLCFDQRGLGQTDKPSGNYTMTQYADDVAALLDTLEIDQIPLIGVSFGGMVAQEFALRHRDRVSAMVLACTSSGGVGGSSYPLHELQNLPARERAVAHLQVADLRHNEQWIQANPEQWQKRIELSLSATRADRDESGASKQLNARIGHDTWERLGELNMPVLLAAGEFDGIAPLSNMQALDRVIPNSELATFRGGHMFLIQDKESYPYIIQWLKSAL